jgi:cytochrome c-type biogenesis protein
MDVGFIAAFFGGGLALLSPCSALLVPAFFASTVGANLRLLVHGFVFYIGLIIILVPFGLGIGAVGTLLTSHHGLVVAITSIIMVLLGILQIFGFGFDLSRLLPGVSKLQQKSSQFSGYLRTLILGAVGGVAGFCAGPILGAILTLAFAKQNTWSAGILLAIYSAGMVIPLIAIAALWKKLGPKGQRVLRGRTFTVLGKEFHTISVITGVVIILVGILFWTTNGLVSLPSLVPTGVLAWLQSYGSVLSGPVAQITAVVVIAAVALWAWWLWQRRAPKSTGSASDAEKTQ